MFKKLCLFNVGEINQGAVLLVFFLLWIWSHGSGTEGYWLCLLVMATRPWGVVASLDFHYQGKYREVFYREDVVFQKG